MRTADSGKDGNGSLHSKSKGRAWSGWQFLPVCSMRRGRISATCGWWLREGETPYLIEHPVQRDGAILNAKDFKVALSGRSTVIEAVTGTADPIAAIDLVSPAREFLKSVVIEGRMGG